MSNGLMHGNVITANVICAADYDRVRRREK